MITEALMTFYTKYVTGAKLLYVCNMWFKEMTVPSSQDETVT